MQGQLRHCVILKNRTVLDSLSHQCVLENNFLQRIIVIDVENNNECADI
jgi:hypothetical protein